MINPPRFVSVVPAAGRSRRMGRDKLLLPWGDTVVLGSVLDALAKGGASPVMVVVSAENRELSEWLDRRGQPSAVNASPERGMLSSVQEGVVALGGGERLSRTRTGLLVCPGDHAGLAPPAVRAICDALAGGARLAVPTCRDRRGHPLGIGAELLPEIATLDLDIGLRQLLDRQAASVVEIPVDDPAINRDLDTPEDYARATAST